MVYEDRRPRFNIAGTLDTGISALDTTVSSLAFVDLPTFYSSSIYLPAVLANDSTGKAERIFIVGHASASRSVSVVRGREGDTALAFSAGDTVRCAPTPWDVQRVGGHGGQTGSFNAMTTAGVVVPIAGQDLYGGVAVASNALVAPVAGLYRVSYRFYISGGSGYYAYLRIHKNGVLDTSFPIITIYKGTTQDYADFTSVQKRLTANDALQMQAVCSTAGGSVFGSTGYDGGYIELELIQQQQ